jgi:hypothetical protein
MAADVRKVWECRAFDRGSMGLNNGIIGNATSRIVVFAVSA